MVDPSSSATVASANQSLYAQYLSPTPMSTALASPMHLPDGNLNSASNLAGVSINSILPSGINNLPGISTDSQTGGDITPPTHPATLDQGMVAGVLAALIRQGQATVPSHLEHDPLLLNKSSPSGTTLPPHQSDTVIEVLTRLVNVQEEMNVRMDRVERAVVGLVQRIESMANSLHTYDVASNLTHTTLNAPSPPPMSIMKRHRDSPCDSARVSPPIDKRRRLDDKRSLAPASFAGDPCYNCGGYDHISRECPEERQSCANCGKFGHLIDFCFQPIRNTLKAKPKPSSSKVPSTDNLLDSLFHQHVAKPIQAPEGMWLSPSQSTDLPKNGKHDAEEDGEVC